MEIKNISGIMNTYTKVGMNTQKKSTSSVANKNVDKIEFDFARSVEAAKSDLSAKLDEEMSADKIQSMSEQVQNQNYEVNENNLADAILMF